MDRIDEAVVIAMDARRRSYGRTTLGSKEAQDFEAMRAALLAGMKVLLGDARPAILCVDSDRVAFVDRHDECPSSGFKNVWVYAPSLGEGDGR